MSGNMIWPSSQVAAHQTTHSQYVCIGCHAWVHDLDDVIDRMYILATIMKWRSYWFVFIERPRCHHPFKMCLENSIFHHSLRLNAFRWIIQRNEMGFLVVSSFPNAFNRINVCPSVKFLFLSPLARSRPSSKDFSNWIFLLFGARVFIYAAVEKSFEEKGILAVVCCCLLLTTTARRPT